MCTGRLSINSIVIPGERDRAAIKRGKGTQVPGRHDLLHDGFVICLQERGSPTTWIPFPLARACARALAGDDNLRSADVVTRKRGRKGRAGSR
jgi:hypothetical protein